MKSKKYILGLVILGLAIPSLAGAAMFLGEKDGNVLIKNQSDIRDNIYAAGKSVSIQQAIFGDVLVAGATVSISENVADDVWAAGANVSVLGGTGGDARLAGSSVLINAPVGKDLLAAGGTVSISSKTTVGNDMALAGGIVTFDGVANKSAKIVGGEIIINGTINGDATIMADEKLSFGPGAKIKGNLNYSSRKEMVVPEGVVSGKVTYEVKNYGKRNTPHAWLPGMFAGFGSVSFLMMLVGALALLYILPSLSREITTTALTKVGNSFLRGFIVLIVMPIAGLILLATILGWLVGWVTLAVFALILVISKAGVALIFGAFLAKIIRKDGIIHMSWKTATLGALGLSLLCLIPIIGWAIMFLVWLISFGSTATYIFEKLWLGSRN